MHDLIVPHGIAGNPKQLLSLELPENAYTKSLILAFGEIAAANGCIPIQYDVGKKEYFVEDKNTQKYRWLANLKYKRALRFAQGMSQNIARVGFDEFAPHRK